MNTKSKKWFWNYWVSPFLSWWIIVFGKTMENVRKNRYIKLVITERKRNYLVSEPNYHTTIFFLKNFISNRNEKNIFMNKPVHLGLLILELSKISMYEFCIDYVQLTCGEKVKLCDMDTEVSLYTQKQMIFIKTIHKMLKLDLIFQIMN